MARAKSTGNGSDLEDAIRALTQAHVTLAHAQATFLAQLAESNERWAENPRRWLAVEVDMAETKRRTDERFALIESLLLEHNRILQALPDVLREKIGFKPANT